MEKLKINATWASHSLSERALAYNNLRIIGGLALLALLLLSQLLNPSDFIATIIFITIIDFLSLIWHRISTLKGKEKKATMRSLITTSVFITLGLHFSGGAATLGYSLYFALLISTALIFRSKKSAYIIGASIILLYSSLIFAELKYLLPTNDSVFYNLYIYPRHPLLFANVSAGILLIIIFSYASGKMAEILGNWSISLTKEVEEKTSQYIELLSIMENSYTDIVITLANAIEAKDNYTEEHSERIKEWAIKTATILGCDAHFINRLGFASILHDIGKIGIPDRILHKEGPLSNEERIEIQKHTIIGERILSNIKEFQDVAKFVRAHHERYDGKGYPDGLSGEEIPLASRIISVIDTYIAITDERIYNPARSSSEAIQILIHASGKQFDPEVVDAFLYALQLEKGKKREQ